MTNRTGTGRPCDLCGETAAELLIVKKGYDVVRCLTCDLVYVGNPPPSSERANRYNAPSYHERFIDDSGRFERDWGSAKRRLKLIAKYKKEGRILDLGCSAGFFLRVAKDHGWHTQGIEINDRTAAIARERHDLNVQTGALQQNSFAPGLFDIVTLWDVLEHLEHPRQTMVIVNTILADGGMAVISTPNMDGLFPRLSYKVAHLVNHWRHVEPPGHLFQFSQRTLARLLEATGFRILRTYHRRIPLDYSFDTFLNFKRFLYSLVFIPIALIGPLLRSGDSMIVVARKVRECG